MITFKDIINNEELKTYVKTGNHVLSVLGYTDHSEAHTVKVGETASDILHKLGFSEREQELAKIAAFIHDIGNGINRKNHAQTGALMAFYLLNRIGMQPDEIAMIIAAIGNHDEDAGIPISPISAALIIADKSDVRRSRVRNTDFLTFDIHDRVNYAVTESKLAISDDREHITLNIRTDNEISTVMDYFEIFLTRMIMCRRASEFLRTTFHLIVNDTVLS